MFRLNRCLASLAGRNYSFLPSTLPSTLPPRIPALVSPHPSLPHPSFQPPSSLLQHFSSSSPKPPAPVVFSAKDFFVFYPYDDCNVKDIKKAMQSTLSSLKGKGIVSPKLYVQVFSKLQSLKNDLELIKPQLSDCIVDIQVSPPPQNNGANSVANKMREAVGDVVNKAESSRIKPTLFLIHPPSTFKGLIANVSKTFNVYLLLEGNVDDHCQLIKFAHHYWVIGGSKEGVRKTWKNNPRRWDSKSGIWI